MKVIVTKGPNSKETERRLFQYLHKVLLKKAREIEEKKLQNT